MMSSWRSIALRIWRDRAFRSLPLWGVFTLLCTNALAGLILFRVAFKAAPEVPAYQVIAALWLPIAFYLLFGRTRTRCHRLDLALPISARGLWLSHAVAVTVAAGLLLAAAAGLLALDGRLLARLPGGPDPDLRILPVVPPITAALLLVIVVAQRLQPGYRKPAGGARYWAPLVATLAALTLVLLVLSSRPLLATGFFLLPAVVLGQRAWASLPSAFELVPVMAGAGPDPAAATADTATTTLRLSGEPVGTTAIVRMLFNVLHDVPPWRQALPWVFYLFVLLVGFFLSGAFDLWTDFNEARFINIPLGSYVLFAGAGLLTYNLHRLDPLPVSRRALFRILTLPSLLIFCLGWGGGRLVLRAMADTGQLVDYHVAGGHQWVEIDPGFMGVSTTGEAPLLTSPWGESHRAWYRPLFRGGRAILYSPFATAEKSSPRFEALMTSRAIERIYGRTIPADEILERYFEVDAEELVGLKGEGLTLLEDHPGLVAPADGPETPVYLALILVPWLLLLALFVRSFRSTATKRLVRGVYWAGLFALLSLLVGQFVLILVAGYNPSAAHGLMEILLRRLVESPLAALAAWVSSFGLVFLSYRLAQTQFLRSELPTAPIRCTLMTWGVGD